MAGSHDSFVKEEVGALPGQMVVSAVVDGCVIWQRSVHLGELEWARELAGKAIKKERRKYVLPRQQ